MSTPRFPSYSHPVPIDSSLQILDRTHQFYFGYNAAAYPRPEVFVTNGEFRQGELDGFADVLSCRVRENWVVKNDDGTFDMVSGRLTSPYKFVFPTIIVTPGLGDPPGRLPANKAGSEPNSPIIIHDYTYIVILEGRDEFGAQKVVTKNTPVDAAELMMREGFKGYSTIFSGAILRCNFDKIFGKGPSTFYLKKVQDVDEALKVESEDSTGTTVAVFC